ncbi:MAG: hypothetical protein AAF598_08140 [Bacteroidota bacterium]
MKFSKIFFGLVVMMAFTLTVQAQVATPRMSNKQVNQQQRIKQGVASGELTKAETLRLQKQQVNIHRTKKAAKADGVVTRKEKAVIHGKQTKASANIRRQKNDGQNRY